MIKIHKFRNLTMHIKIKNTDGYRKKFTLPKLSMKINDI